MRSARSSLRQNGREQLIGQGVFISALEWGRLAVTGLRWLFSRGTKIYGNSTKLISWALYLLNPHLRFSIPHTSGPLLARPQKHKIPKIIWQTNYTDRVTIAVYFNYLCNRWLSPTYSYRFMRDSSMNNFPAVSPRLMQNFKLGRLRPIFGAFWCCIDLVAYIST